MRHQVLQRWKWQSCAGQPGMAVATCEVMTDDEYNQHICYVHGSDVAQHLVDLHNRTFGDGQLPPTVEEAIGGELLGNRPAFSEPRLSDAPRRRAHVAAYGVGMRRATAHVDALHGVAELIEGLVRDRMALVMAAQPARIVIDGDPVAMANVLTKLGWEVSAPEPEVDMKEDPR